MSSRPRIDANMIALRLDDPARLRGSVTRQLYDYWRDKRGDRHYPDWPDIQLMDLWRIAGNLVVKDVIDAGDDFRNRYWGGRVTDASGLEGSGKTTRAMYGPEAETVFVNFRRVVATGEPVVSYRRLTYVDQREYVTFEAVHLPLGPAGGPVAHVITAFDFECDLIDLLGD